MTAEEYIKHYISGQGGFESVSVDVALQAIEYAKQEAREEMTKDAIEGYVDQLEYPGSTLILLSENPMDLKDGDKVKLINIKEERYE